MQTRRMMKKQQSPKMIVANDNTSHSINKWNQTPDIQPKRKRKKNHSHFDMYYGYMSLCPHPYSTHIARHDFSKNKKKPEAENKTKQPMWQNCTIANFFISFALFAFLLITLSVFGIVEAPFLSFFAFSRSLTVSFWLGNLMKNCTFRFLSVRSVFIYIRFWHILFSNSFFSFRLWCWLFFK